ncbi:DUF2695 domain-containing protein [Pseudonocardia sp. KRD291]|uniref:DUF2695 domain-containing protein n=1 Tax=Pseudonocardia sp. KRD291 TaxID=2792007 RepID=UPI001C49ED8B|nr:DUF2695 domain-containing protein [Pseudonocardia sp. KRD291]MBW0101957.1 DUF2695 domain-containing protein [Pseudonocardia sp. KRD291]
MSIDDIRRPTPFSVDHWRAVMHDAMDQVLDEILDAAENDWSDRLDEDLRDEDLFGDDLFGDRNEVGDDEPPGDPPSAAEIEALGTQLREGLTAAILHGTRFWGCDGTLRCSGEFLERSRMPVDRVLGEYRRSGVACDCAVLDTVLGRGDVVLRCPLRDPGPPPARP